MIIVRSVLSFTGTPNNGSLPIGNGQGFTINTLTAGTNITITNGPGTITIDAAGGGGSPAGSTNEIQYNNAGAFAASANLRWIIIDNRLVLGTENTADTNSRMVVIGKGISTGKTFVVHNQTGTNNTIVALDNGNVGIGTNIPNSKFNVHSLTSISNQTLSNSTNSALLQLQTLGGGSYANNTLLLQSPHGLTFESNGNNGQGYSHSFYSGNSVRAFMVLATTPRTRFVINDTNEGSSYSQYEINQGSSITWIRTVASTGGSNPIIFGKGSGAGTEYSRFTNEGNLLLGTTSQGASATKTLVINNGTAPTNNVTDSFQQYSADIVAGNAAPHFRTENGSIIKLYQETTGIAAAAFVANTSLIANDTATFGGYTIGQVVAALKAQGLLA